jgi:hypothetical protein
MIALNVAEGSPQGRYKVEGCRVRFETRYVVLTKLHDAEIDLDTDGVFNTAE